MPATINNTDADTISALKDVQNLMDRLGDCTTDSIMIFVHHFGRICAKVQSKRDGTFAGWGDSVLQATQNLKDEILKVI